MVDNPSDSRIVTVSSMAHSAARFELGLMNEKNYSVLYSYPQSKAANVLFSLELGRRLKGHGVTTYSLHPGGIITELSRHIPFANNVVVGTVLSAAVWPFVKTVKHGAQTSICCAVDEKLAEETGKYYSDCAEAEPSENAQSEENAKALWDFSVALLKLHPSELHPLLR